MMARTPPQQINAAVKPGSLCSSTFLLLVIRYVAKVVGGKLSAYYHGNAHLK
ncbi:MAG: hypothetical protein ACO4AC_04165 [Pseudohongiellaceae bacterium]